MKAAKIPQLLHDLRAPLARALTYSKLLEEARPEESAELLPPLRKALEDLERLLRAAEESA